MTMIEKYEAPQEYVSYCHGCKGKWHPDGASCQVMAIPEVSFAIKSGPEFCRIICFGFEKPYLGRCLLN